MCVYNIPCIFLDKPIMHGCRSRDLDSLRCCRWPMTRKWGKAKNPLQKQTTAAYGAAMAGIISQLTIAVVKKSTTAFCHRGATPFNNTSLSHKISLHHCITFHFSFSLTISTPHFPHLLPLPTLILFVGEGWMYERIQLLAWDKESSGSRRGAERRKWFNVAARLSTDLLLLGQGWNIFFLRHYMFSSIL